MAYNKADYRLELYKRYLENPTDPEHNLWWDSMDDSTKNAIAELNKRQREFDQYQNQVIEKDETKQSLVNEILGQNTISPELFKATIPRQLDASGPKNIGLVQYNQDNSRDVKNDSKILNIMMMDDKMPLGMDLDGIGRWAENIYKKGQYENLLTL